MKKPYLKKYGKVSNFTVWIVDGNYIRKNVDPEFTNFDQHYHVKYIPKNEFWIDKRYGEPGEEKYYIAHLLVENKLMSQGKSYKEALYKGSVAELKERRNSKKIKKLLKLNKKILIKKIKKRLWKEYSNKLKVWIVNGKLLRSLIFVDFTEGGHDRIYSFIPNNEIWIDDDLGKHERKFVLLHESYERNLMCGGLRYDDDNSKGAHSRASELELEYRKNPKEIDKRIKDELKKSPIV